MNSISQSTLQSRKRQPFAEIISDSQDHYELKLKQLLRRKQADRENPLEHHSISPSLRARMADWMIEIISSFNLKHRTYFLSVNLMDIFLKSTQREFSSNELHIIGVTCIVIASKFNDTNFLTIQQAQRFVSNGEFRCEDLVNMEKEVFGLINHHVGMVTAYDIVRVLCEKYNTEAVVKRTAITILYLLQMYYDAVGMSISVQGFSAFVLSLQTLGFRDVVEQVKAQGDCCLELKHIETVYNAVKRFKERFPMYGNPNRFLGFEFSNGEEQGLFVLKPSQRFK